MADDQEPLSGNRVLFENGPNQRRNLSTQRQHTDRITKGMGITDERKPAEDEIPFDDAMAGCHRLCSEQPHKSILWDLTRFKKWRLPTLAESIKPLPSATLRLTAVFGMGTGRTAASWPPLKS